MSKWSDPTLTVDEAILVAEKHPDVDGICDAYHRASRATTADRPHES